jgi:hypothetical protein
VRSSSRPPGVSRRESGRGSSACRPTSHDCRTRGRLRPGADRASDVTPAGLYPAYNLGGGSLADHLAVDCTGQGQTAPRDVPHRPPPVGCRGGCLTRINLRCRRRPRTLLRRRRSLIPPLRSSDGPPEAINPVPSLHSQRKSRIRGGPGGNCPVRRASGLVTVRVHQPRNDSGPLRAVTCAYTRPEAPKVAVDQSLTWVNG